MIDAEVAAALHADDEATFTALATRHQRELHIHCYRLTGSVDDADDLVQETLLRAWAARRQFAGRATVRAWLYRIATNAGLDLLARRPPPRRAFSAEARSVTSRQIAVVQPYPDHWLDELAASGGPEATVITRETIELAFIAAMQCLPPRQRAVVILRDIVGWSAREVADLLGISVAAANSALQRARATLKRHLPARRLDWTRSSALTAVEHALVQRYMAAIVGAGDAALAALLRDDVEVAHQPGAGGNTATDSGWYQGRGTVLAAWAPIRHGPDAPALRLLPAAANRQPATGMYVRPPGAASFVAFALAVLLVESGVVAEVAVFGADRFASFGLPPTWEAPVALGAPPMA